MSFNVARRQLGLEESSPKAMIAPKPEEVIPSVNPVVGTYVHKDSGFTDTMIIRADGTATLPHDRSSFQI